MKSINSAKKMALAVALLATIGAAAITSASAQGQNDRQDRWSRSHMSRYAFALGYSRGYDDAAQGNYRSYRELQRWREGTEGWEDPMGPRASFRDNFRRGFAQGFTDARRGRSRRFSQSDIDHIRSQFNDHNDRRPYRQP
jgi:hypothetical protein